MTPNQDQIAAVLRIIIPVICTWLAARGFPWLGDAAIVAQVTAVVISIAAIVWSAFKHTDAAKIKSAAEVDPQVQIQVPRALEVTDKSVAKLVQDSTVPNVTRR